ncbi:hypothetical protein D6D85_11855 [Candidatus Methanodesulfokora washburnensis]|uniref:Uncharacterized protein n=2 Tax=Candidatus Methanodesulfokora washburnensis TaxID=2478471 RepID=A0A3R9QTN7_9CREN|nr:hypothetical protein D6D85_11855 [Candidatus Methanodesulfokores washburnensis]
MTPDGVNKRGESMSEEVISIPLDKLEGELRNIVGELEKGKLESIDLNITHWLDDYNGKYEYETVHGFKLEREKFSELYDLVKRLLDIAEIKHDRMTLYATVEHGISVHTAEDVRNPYGRDVGVDHNLFSLEELVEMAKEKKKEYNTETLKNAILKLLSSL